MKTMLLFATVVICVCLLSWLQISSHQRIHRRLAIKEWIVQGTSIGVIADQLRRERLLPVGCEDFRQRYAYSFGIKWRISTNAQGDLLFCSGEKPAWMLRQIDGSVRSTSSIAGFEAALGARATNFDFSVPLSQQSIPAVFASNFLLRTTSDSIWKFWQTTGE